MTTDELLQEINLRPIERRILIAEYILKSLNPADSDIKTSWKKEVERRMKAVKEGQSRVIPSQYCPNKKMTHGMIIVSLGSD